MHACLDLFVACSSVFVLPWLLLRVLGLPTWLAAQTSRFLDAYQGPYGDKFRFWTGLMLVLRVVLFTIFASNYENDPSFSSFCTITAVAPFVAVLIKTAVYRHPLAKWIQMICLLNLIALFSINWLTATTVYKKWHVLREYATYVSVVIMMLVFLGILLYQLILTFCPNAFTKQERRALDTTVSIDEPAVTAPTSSLVELKECDQLRELLLEST